MIKKYNLDPSLVQWIMTQTGLGPGFGDVRYLCKKNTLYYSWLRDNMNVHPAKIHFDLPTAYNALTAARNDILLVLPGTYTLTSTLSWGKTMTHMFGIGNPLWRTGWKTLITNATTGVSATMDITAAGVSMGGLAIGQQGAFTSCLTALRITSTHFYGKQLEIFGHLASEVVDLITSSSLEFANGTLSGYGTTFEDCSIGVGGGDPRGAASGVINFKGISTGAAYIEFHKCRILSRSDATTPYFVLAATPNSIDRYALFKDCLFDNFSAGQAFPLASAFYMTSASGGDSWFLLKDCMAAGLTEWQTMDRANEKVLANMPIVGTGGGLGLQPTGTLGT